MRSRPRAALALAAALLLASCGPSTDDGGPTGAASTGPESTWPAPDPAGTEALEVDGRPFELAVPSGLDPDEPAPLVVVLHGFGDTPAGVDARLALRAEAERRGVLYALPAGTPDASGRLFWDAADACCGWDGPDVDDSGHLAALIRTVGESYAVDPERVALVGHSNGGFMAYRAACDHADLVRVVVSVAGAVPADDTGCSPSRPVDVVQVHGTDDLVVRPEGGRLFRADYASAAGTVGAWARYDGCDPVPDVVDGALDLDVGIDGAETSVSTFPGCADGSRVELWTVDGAGHSPTFGDAFATEVLDVVVGTDAGASR